jgi:hypothetical protein
VYHSHQGGRGGEQGVDAALWGCGQHHLHSLAPKGPGPIPGGGCPYDNGFMRKNESMNVEASLAAVGLQW